MNADICIIVPVIRGYRCIRAYSDNARARGFDPDRLFVLFAIEDFCDTEGMASMPDDEGASGVVFDGMVREEWYDDRGVSEYSYLVLTADHAQTGFSLLYIWMHLEFDYGALVDGDTLPHDKQDFFDYRMANLNRTDEVESMSSDERWANVFYQSVDEYGPYSCGYPYSVIGETAEIGVREFYDTVVSQGLWTNAPDLDMVRILVDDDLEGQTQTRTDFDDLDGDFVAEPGQYPTVCLMSLALEHEVILASYQLPMDGNEQEVGRFDNIWLKVFLERVADVLGEDTATGYPLREHNKAARPTFDDLNSEVPGLEFNEHLWEVVDAAGGDADSYAGVFETMADAPADGDWSDYRNGDFFNYAGKHMRGRPDRLGALAAPRVAVSADD